MTLLHDRRRQLIGERNELRSLRRQAIDPRFARVSVLFVPGRDFANTATGTFAPRTVTYGDVRVYVGQGLPTFCGLVNTPRRMSQRGFFTSTARQRRALRDVSPHAEGILRHEFSCSVYYGAWGRTKVAMTRLFDTVRVTKARIRIRIPASSAAPSRRRRARGVWWPPRPVTRRRSTSFW